MPRQLIHIPALSSELQEAIKHERAYISLTRGPMKIDTRAATGSEPAEMYIYGEIGNPFDGADSATFGRFMRTNRGKPINVRINSGGGLAYDGITIHNAILQHDAPTMTIIEGMAGSAASIIAVAGSTVQMFQNATFFIHRAQLQVIGNADVMKEALSWLDKIDQQIIDTYKARTGRPRSMIMKEMVGAGGDGTEFNAAEALAGKYIDKIMPLKRGTTAAETDFNPLSMKDDGDRRLRSIARLRDARIRSRKDLLPRAVVAQAGFQGTAVIREPKAQGGPMYDVGDMVQVMEDGKMVGSGEVRMSMLGYMYDVMQADGTMMEGCCEGDLMPMMQPGATGRSPRNTVPSNPPGGNGTGVEGAWNKLALQDFTDQSWESLSDSERSRISKFFAWYSDLSNFGNLHLGHHFASGSNAGKASLAGVRNALARLNQVQGMSAADRDRAQAHLQAHLEGQD